MNTTQSSAKMNQASSVSSNRNLRMAAPKPQDVVFSGDVLQSLRMLPESEREAVARSIFDEFVMGVRIFDSLTPFQAVLREMIADTIRRGTSRHNNATAIC